MKPVKFIHPSSEVHSDNIGHNTSIWQFCVVLKNAVIGENCNINCHCFIENDVVLGDNVTIKSGVYLWDGVRIGDNVFIGPNVTFINDKYPKSKEYPEKFMTTVIMEGASIGAGSIIMGGITIGRNVLIGAGSFVNKSIPDNSVVFGSPARVVRQR
jgi:acetyltransferase-like isoleucine patch superfamily enzyme